MANNLTRTVLVTGAASGIGLSCAQMCLARGDNVLATDVNLLELERNFAADSENLSIVSGDITDPDFCKHVTSVAVHRFGRLDCLANWAGIISSTTWDELTAAEFQKILNVNVIGSFLIAQSAALHMQTRNKGAIVLTSSTTVLSAGVGGSAGSGGPAYISSKAAITGLVRTLARSLGPSGIRVNGVAPGVTDTPMIKNYSPENRLRQSKISALGRIGTPDEIAEVAHFLMSDASSFMTGELVIVNGGAQFG